MPEDKIEMAPVAAAIQVLSPYLATQLVMTMVA